MHSGRIPDVAGAIAAAREKYGSAPAPRHRLVRQHLEGLRLQAEGGDARRRAAVDLWGAADALMTVLELALDDAALCLVGRAARGHGEAGAAAHVRVYTEASVRDLAELLVAQGYEEPRIETAHTRWGRLDRLRFHDDGRTWVVTRCAPSMWRDAKLDLFTRKAIEILPLEAVRKRLEAR